MVLYTPIMYLIQSVIMVFIEVKMEKKRYGQLKYQLGYDCCSDMVK